MSITSSDIKSTLEDFKLTFETDGQNFIHAGPGRYAELISTVITVDEDLAGATVMSTLPDKVAPEKRPAVYELMNLIHGQNLWNFRCHLDDDGRFLTLAKVSTWGKGYNPTQFGDIFFMVLVTTDRISPCLKAIVDENKSGVDAFENFFLKKGGQA